MLDAAVPARTTLADDSLWARTVSLATDRATWRALLYLPTKALLVLVVAVFGFVTFSTGTGMLFVSFSYQQGGLYVGLPTDRPVELHPAVHFGWNNPLVGFETVVNVGVWEITTLGDALIVAAVGSLVCLLGIWAAKAIARVLAWYTTVLLRETFDPVGAVGGE